MSYMHFPVIAVMGQFLTAFLVEIFGSKNKTIRNTLVLLMSGAACVLIYYLIIPVFLHGEIISYWMGNWEPVSGYAIGIGYEVDGLSLLFALMVVTTSFLSNLFSIRAMEHDHHLGHYYTLALMLSGSILGLTLTGDIFNMFVMFEVSCFAGAALIAFRNNSEGAVEAGIKYLLLDSIGSKLVLLGIALLYLQAHTLNMAQLASVLHNNLNPLSIFAFGLMFGGLCVKSFLFPAHTPEVDGQSVAPAGVSAMMSGMVMKAGICAMIRLLYVIFRAIDINALQYLVTALGTVSMIFGACMAIQQKDLRRMLAFSSISQIGYVVVAFGLGTAAGMYGALFHAVNHTLFKVLLFLVAGAIFHAAGTTSLEELGGLSKRMPKTTIVFLAGMFAIAGLPPFNGFVSKWLIYQATFEKALASNNIFYLVVCIAALIVSSLTLAYFVKITHSVFFGELPEKLKDTKEVPLAMRLPMWILALASLASGIFYKPFTDYVLTPAVNAVFNVSRYIDSMMGAGYAAAANVVNIEVTAPAVSYWDPILWLVLFVIMMVAALLVTMIGTSDRGKVSSTNEENTDGKYAVFFSGEKSQYSHMKGSDLFWGLKQNWKPYFNALENAHSGNINDYSQWIAVLLGIVIVFFNIFVK